MTKTTWCSAVGCLVLLACLPSGALAADVTDDDVQQAIDKGVAWLFSRQTDKGWFSPGGYFAFGDNQPEDRRTPGGLEAMAMLALTFAPVSIKDERMLKGFDALLEFEMRDVYAIAPRIMIISRLLNKLDRERRERAVAVLKKDIKFIEDAQNNIGAWGYGAHTPDTYGWDFSNTQMAVLALSEADMAGIELKPDAFLKVQKLYLERQRDDKGWNYGMRGGFQDQNHPDGAAVGSYGSMTAAAVATLFITRDFLYRGIGCPCKNERSGRRPKMLDDAIDGGLEWLGKHFTVTVNPFGSKHHWKYYWLYSCERVGLAAGIKYFGTHDWYREGAQEVVTTQRPDGSWGESIPQTAYAICFLAKGRAPILVNKVMHKGEWNNHPRDVANLAKYVGARKEQPFNWQVIHMDVPVKEWHDAPILYITAEVPIELTAEEKKKLREYTDTGGTILFEASCGNRKVATWWRNVVKELWPEWELEKLEKEHALFSSDTKMSRIPMLFGMDDGVRTIMFFSTADLSCPWNTMAVAKRPELFDVGMNLFVYSTDRRPLRARLAGVTKTANQAYLSTHVLAGKRAKLRLARVKHGGDYYVGRNYGGPALLAEALSGAGAGDPEVKKLMDEAQLPAERRGEQAAGGGPVLELAGEMAAANLKPDEVQIAYLAGRRDIDVAQADAAAIKAYLAGGGFLLVEAVMGDRRADAAWQKVAPTLGLRMKPLETTHPLLTGAMEGATGYRLDSVKYRHALKTERIGKPFPDLYGLYLGDKLVGVYSPFDVMYCHMGYDSWDCRGYEAEDARAILTNILVYVSTL